MPSPGTIVQKEGGIISIPSNHSVDETVDKLKNILQSKQITLFALIDHGGETEKVGMKMRSIKLLLFGSPKTGSFHCQRMRSESESQFTCAARLPVKSALP